MDQLSILFAPLPRARKKDPDTSHRAATKAAGMAVNHRNRIMAVLDRPQTIKEIAARLGDLDHVAVARRMPELKELKLAHPTEERRDGCRVWARGAE